MQTTALFSDRDREAIIQGPDGDHVTVFIEGMGLKRIPIKEVKYVRVRNGKCYPDSDDGRV